MAHTVNIQDYARFIGLSMISKGLSVSPLKLQKILYYQQAWSMVFFGREEQLFAEAPQAWVNGPVYPSVYRRYKGCVSNMCEHLKPSDFGVTEDDIPGEIQRLVESLGLNGRQVELSDSVNMLYGSKTQNQLIFVTHSELPWCEAREGLLPYQASNREISLDTMFRYYKERHDRKRAGR